MSFNFHFSAATRNKSYSFQKEDLEKGEALELDLLDSIVIGQFGAGKTYDQHSITKMRVYPSPTNGGTMVALKALSLQGKIQMLQLGLMGLKLNQPGTLNIYVRHEHLPWPTTSENYSLFVHSSHSYQSIIRPLFKFLDENDMGQWGPLMRICECIGNFNRRKPGSNYIINVTLTD